MGMIAVHSSAGFVGGGCITEETIGLLSSLVILIGFVVTCSLICVCQGLLGKMIYETHR